MKVKHMILIFGLFSFLQITAQGGRYNFDKMDRNGDSFVEIDELRRFYLGKLNRAGREINADVLFKSKDINGDEILTFSEFSQQGIRNISNSKKGNKNGLNNAPIDKKKSFEKMDNNSDGVVVFKEMESFYMNRKNIKGEPFNTSWFFKHLDKNKNGEISFDEFNRPMRKKKQ